MGTGQLCLPPLNWKILSMSNSTQNTHKNILITAHLGLSGRQRLVCIHLRKSLRTLLEHCSLDLFHQTALFWGPLTRRPPAAWLIKQLTKYISSPSYVYHTNYNKNSHLHCPVTLWGGHVDDICGIVRIIFFKVLLPGCYLEYLPGTPCGLVDIVLASMLFYWNVSFIIEGFIWFNSILLSNWWSTYMLPITKSCCGLST